MTIKKIIACQRKFFDKGITKNYGFRMAALERLERALEEYETELVRALQADLNKSPSESYMAEIGMTKSELCYVKQHLHKWMRPEKVLTPLSQFPAKSCIMPEPYGVTLIMAPWNYPVLLCLEPLINAIAAGNCVLLKPSAYAPTVSSVLKKLLASVFPEKYVAVVEGGRQENALLLEQRFDYIFFTGGAAVGKIVLEKAAGYVTPVTLELGGKSPCIVDKTADLYLAAKRIAFGKLLNAGQTCVAPDYVIVHEEVREEFLKFLKGHLTTMMKGNALENSDYPKIINEKHYKRVLGLLKKEKIIFGGTGNPDTLQIQPTILTDVALTDAVMQEEIFGPVIPVLTFSEPDDLKTIIGSYEKPLAFYLFTGSEGMKRWALRTFSFGGGCINDTIVHLASSRLPFGGVGGSGMGSYHGKAGFLTFSHKKSIVENRVFPDIPLRYQPYSEWKDKWIRRFL